MKQENIKEEKNKKTTHYKVELNPKSWTVYK